MFIYADLYTQSSGVSSSVIDFFKSTLTIALAATLCPAVRISRAWSTKSRLFLRIEHEHTIPEYVKYCSELSLPKARSIYKH